MTTTLKEHAVRTAQDLNLPIDNINQKSACDIFHEVDMHKREMELLDERTVRVIQQAAERNLIRLAERYGISYDQDNINYSELRDKIEDYQFLLSRAKELGIAWEESDYDPVALKQSIEEIEHESFEENYRLRDWYHSVIL